MKLLPVVMSCLKNNFLWENILKKHKDCIIFCGKQMDTDFLLENRILYLNCGDTYERLPEKVICMIDAILKIDVFSDVTHIIKIDDHDTDFSDEINSKLSDDILKSGDYFGQKVFYPSGGRRSYHFNKCSKNSFWNKTAYSGKYESWASGGDGYILSRNAMSIINKKYSNKDIDFIYKNHIYEDVMISLILKESNISPVKLNDIITSNLPPKKNISINSIFSFKSRDTPSIFSFKSRDTPSIFSFKSRDTPSIFSSSLTRLYRKTSLKGML